MVILGLIAIRYLFWEYRRRDSSRKGIAAFIPPILSAWMGALIFMASTDYILVNAGLGYYYFPSWNAGVMLLLLAPLGGILSIEVAVMVSSRVSDVRGANQIAGLIFISFVLVFATGAQGLFSFSIANLIIFSAVVIVLYFLSKATFRREEILTKWK